MATTYNFSFTFWQEGVTQIQTIYNDMAATVDRWLGRGVLSRTTDAEPVSPSEGDAYIITGAATGTNWGTFTQNYLAVYLDGAWTQYAPVNYVGCYVVDEAANYYWNGASWAQFTSASAFVDNVFRIQDNGDNTKQLAFEVSALTTATTRTITMPDADVNLSAVGQVEFTVDTFRLLDNVDNTKELDFDLSGITTATTRTITMPDEDLAPTAAGVTYDGAITYLGVNNQTGTTYGFDLTDAGKLVTCDNAADITATIPANASVAFPIGTKIDVLQLGAGQVTIAITTDTLLGNVLIDNQYEVVSCIKIAATTWVVVGGVA